MDQVAFAPNSQLLACASRPGVVDIWDDNRIPPQSTGWDGVETVVVATSSPTGQYLASLSRAGLLRVWDMMQRDFFPVLKTDFDPTHSLHISENGSRLALWSVSNYAVTVLDLPSGKLLGTLLGGIHRFLAFSPDGQLAATSGGRGGLFVYDVGGKEDCTFVTRHFDLRAAAFSPDGRLLAAAFHEQIEVFSGSGWKLRHKIRLMRAHALAIAPNNEWIAYASNNSVGLCDLKNGGVHVATLDAGCQVKRLCFSSNGRQLMTELGRLTLPAKAVAMPLSEKVAWLHFHIRGEWVMFDNREVCGSCPTSDSCPTLPFTLTCSPGGTRRVTSTTSRLIRPRWRALAADRPRERSLLSRSSPKRRAWRGSANAFLGVSSATEETAVGNSDAVVIR